jgi:rare lipoprotein A
MHPEPVASARACAALRLAACVAAALLAACTAAPRRVPAPAPAPATSPGGDGTRTDGHANHGNPPFYEVAGQRYTVLASAADYLERGVASWYGPDFHGHSTSSGETYDMYAMTAAHRTLPLPCYARVTNLANGRSVVVRINDRGPFVGNRIVDLSYAAARALDIVRTGTAFVELRTLGDTQGTEASLAAAAMPLPAPAAAADAAPAAAPAATPASAPAPTSMPAPVPLPSPPEAGPAGAIYMQVGAFAGEANARRVVERLAQAGIAKVSTTTVETHGQTLRRVRIGPLASVEEFDHLDAQLTALGYPEARLATD